MGIVEASGVAKPVQNRPGFTFFNIRVKKLHKDAIVPTRAHSTDAGLDLYALEEGCISPQSQGVVGTGIAVAIPENVVGLIFVRSSVGFNHNVTLSNSVGVIDTSYRGELKVALTNHSTKPFIFSKGDRIAQLVLSPILLANPVEVEDLGATDRGEGGIGSTGT